MSFTGSATSQVIRGVVKWFNVTLGFGMIDGDDGRQYFVGKHSVNEADEVVQAGKSSAFRFLMKGWKVSFRSVSTERGFDALDVTPDREIGVSREKPDPRAFSEKEGFVRLLIDSLGRIRVGSDSIYTPTITGKTAGTAFRAYLLEGKKINGFQLRLPVSTTDTSFVLLNQNERLVPFNRSGYYPDVMLGSLLCKVERNGQVTLWLMGVRTVNDRSAYYIMIERRYFHRYDFTDSSAESLLAQTPTSGMKKDNDLYVPAIAKGIQLLSSASVEQAVA
ncbi:MAG: cold shock domain-containing protein [Patescibacteria group bacterium]